MISGLFGGKLAYRREHSEGVARQHDNIRWLMTDHTRNPSIGNVFNWIGASCVFGDANIIVVRDSRYRIVDNIFQDAAKTDRIVDGRLLFRRQIDTFGIAATFNVEDSRVRPDMLIVANQKPAGFR